MKLDDWILPLLIAASFAGILLVAYLAQAGVPVQ